MFAQARHSAMVAQEEKMLVLELIWVIPVVLIALVQIKLVGMDVRIFMALKIVPHLVRQLAIALGVLVLGGLNLDLALMRIVQKEPKRNLAVYRPIPLVPPTRVQIAIAGMAAVILRELNIVLRFARRPTPAAPPIRV